MKDLKEINVNKASEINILGDLADMMYNLSDDWDSI